MKRLRSLFVVLSTLAVGLAGVATASVADAATRAPQVKDLSAYATVDHHDRSVVSVRGTYKCFGGQPIHLWVSVKQGGPDPTAMGSSTTVNAWYDTNISKDVRVRCDGEWHTKTVDVGRHPVANYPTDKEGTPPTRKLGYLHEGKAWVQFCLVPPGGEQLLASSSRWVTVHDREDDDD
jgi:hypothetical protein